MSDTFGAGVDPAEKAPVYGVERQLRRSFHSPIEQLADVEPDGIGGWLDDPVIGTRLHKGDGAVRDQPSSTADAIAAA